jgi:hypothetical protein
MHGQPFYKSGKRAVRLLAANALSAIAINSVGDFVLAMAKILVIAATLLVGVLMNVRRKQPDYLKILILNLL